MHSHQAVAISDDYQQVPASYEEDGAEDQSAGGDDARMSLLRSSESVDSNSQLVDDVPKRELTPSEGERRRGRIFVAMSAGAIISTWMLFVTSAWMEFTARSSGDL